MRPGAMLAGAAVVCATVSLLACNKVPTGELGQGEFRYLCAPNQVDSACGDSTLQCDGDPANGATCHLPVAYAVGSRFQIGYAPTTDFGYGTLEGQTNYVIQPASPELASATGNTIVPRRGGWLALLAMQTGLTTVDDFAFVQLAPIAKLTPNLASVTIQTGQSQSLWLTPTDATNAPLAGELECDWTVQTQGGCIAYLPGGTQFGGVTIEGVAPGSGTIQAACGSMTVSIPLTVTGSGTAGSCDGGVGPGDAGDGGADAANDGGTHG